MAEGDKIASEWLETHGKIRMVVALESWLAGKLHSIHAHPEALVVAVEEAELATVSCLQTPNKVLLVVEQPQPRAPQLSGGWHFALDDIRDPGNLGTIIRIADWFGMANVFCSPNCAEIYSPKVVQAAMGGHLRVNVCEQELTTFLRQSMLPVFGATIDGENYLDMKLPKAGILLIGNESKGIAPGLVDLCAALVTIPRYGGAESLNAAVSAGILAAGVHVGR